MRLIKIQILLLLSALAVYAQSGQTLKGKILETMNSGGYTYMLLDTAKDQIWVATTEVKAQKGQNIELLPGMVMENFESKSLGRVFDKIIFSAGPAGKMSKTSGQGHGNTTMSSSKSNEDPIAALSSGNWDQAAPETPSAPSVEKVTKADGANSYTIEEIFKSGNSLNLKPVRIKGTVTKALAQIMGKNWIHLQDGTGDAKKKTHDLVITSQELPKVGEVVTMLGTLYTDKDFGSGYSYKIIVEDASIIK